MDSVTQASKSKHSRSPSATDDNDDPGMSSVGENRGSQSEEGINAIVLRTSVSVDRLSNHWKLEREEMETRLAWAKIAALVDRVFFLIFMTITIISIIILLFVLPREFRVTD